MTAEERLQQMIGAQAFQIAILQTELEKAQLATANDENAKLSARIKELEAKLPKAGDEPHS